MKTKYPILAATVAALFTPLAFAEEIVQQTITSNGVVSQLAPDALVVTSEGSPAARYIITKTTQWVDEDGKLVTRETVKTGVPVRVLYTRVGDRTEVSKVIVRKTLTPTVIEEKTTTTTTTTRKEEDDDDDD